MRTAQDWYDGKRWIADRCPRCGSPNYDEEYDCGYVWLIGDDAYGCGSKCADCGYERGREGDLVQDAPYLAPGEPGSHDDPADYAPFTEDASS